MKATVRVIGTVAFVFLAAFAVVAAAPAGRRPHIVVEPVVSYVTEATDDRVTQIRVSIVNDTSRSIAIEPDGIEVFAAPPARRRRGGRRAFVALIRYPCAPNAARGDADDGTATYVNDTTIVWSTPEPRPSAPPAPRAAPLVIDPGERALTAPDGFATGCEGARLAAPVDVYAAVTWHEPGSPARSRIVSNVVRIDPPTR